MLHLFQFFQHKKIYFKYLILNFSKKFILGFEGVDDFFTILRDYLLDQLATKDNCDTPIATTANGNTSTTTLTLPATNDSIGSGAQHSPRSTNGRTAAVNAANLKASQKMFTDPSPMISYPSSADRLMGQKNADLCVGEMAERNQCFSTQLRLQYNKSPNKY